MLEQLLESNAQWAQSIKEKNADFFSQSALSQSPHTLWIGCADSRCPANVITHQAPGQLFNHQNIANQVNPSDTSCCSVIQFAVDVLKVEHIVVCGHYECGGVKAAMGAPLEPPINDWIEPIRQTFHVAQDELSTLEGKAKEKRLSELNVLAQVKNVCALDTVKNAWQRKQNLAVHGLVYDLESGLLKQVLEPSISG